MSFFTKLQHLKIIIIIFTLFLLILFAGCTEKQRKDLKHIKSGIVGLKRSVTLYSETGVVLKKWEGRFNIEIQGSFISFIDENGKEVKLSGTVIVEEF